jgi:hypothetical protein
MNRITVSGRKSIAEIEKVDKKLTPANRVGCDGDWVPLLHAGGVTDRSQG